MLVIEKAKAGVCCFCHKPASKLINGLSFCPSCGDGELVKIIGKAAKAIEYAEVTVKVLPLRRANAGKKSNRKKGV